MVENKKILLLALLLIHCFITLKIAEAQQKNSVQDSKRNQQRITFKKIVLDKLFRSEGIAIADVNRDGRMDVLAGNLWYEAPQWKPHEIAPVQVFDAAKAWSNSFINYAWDINRDGWMDQIIIGMPDKEAFWRENPKGKREHWRQHVIWRSACNESPAFAPLLPNQEPVLVFAFDNSQMAWYEPKKDPYEEFTKHNISLPKAPGTYKFSHGLGVGDVNGDGRNDVLITKGYWEAPTDPRSSSPWKFVEANLGPDAAQMHVYDVNADGLNDVISSSAHKIGVWWHEQRRGASGPEFVQHEIDNTFSQSHALMLADINNDGLMDIVTGKRFWAHGPTGDVNPGDPAVLYWFELRRRINGKPEWIRHEIDNDSGVGTQFVVADINRDKLVDVIISNKKGVFVFEQQRGGKF